jgi:hypothetical protein
LRGVLRSLLRLGSSRIIRWRKIRLHRRILIVVGDLGSVLGLILCRILVAAGNSDGHR